MPFTPVHMGPGIAVKALLQGSFSLMVFGWTQILMDIQPLVALLTGQSRLHGFTHTYVGALLIAAIAVLSGKHLSEWGLRWLGISTDKPIKISWRVTIISAVIGAFSHVWLDSIMHMDMTPWPPFSEVNSLLGWWSIEQIHRFCMWMGIVGGLAYLGVRWWISKSNKNGIDWR